MKKVARSATTVVTHHVKRKISNGPNGTHNDRNRTRLRGPQCIAMRLQMVGWTDTA